MDHRRVVVGQNNNKQTTKRQSTVQSVTDQADYCIRLGVRAGGLKTIDEAGLVSGRASFKVAFHLQLGMVVVLMRS